MNKWFIGIIASLGCLLLLAALVTAMLSVMYSISYSPTHLAKLPIAIPMAAAGYMLMKWLDKRTEHR